MMLAGVPVAPDSVEELARILRTAGADVLADRLEKALADEVKLLALTIDERAIILGQLEDHPAFFRSTELTPEINRREGNSEEEPAGPSIG